MFVENSAYQTFRRSVVENDYLYAVVSLPHGVFKPYASVKTHILLLDRKISKQTKSILFIDIESDGYTQTDTRLPVDQNDLPAALQMLSDYRKDPSRNVVAGCAKGDTPEAYFVAKKAILENSECALIGRWYNLASKYPKKQKTPFRSLFSLCDFKQGLSPNMKTLPGEYPLVTPAEDRKTADHYDYEGPAVCVPMVSSSGHGKADVKRLHYQEGKFAIATTMLCLTPKPDSNLSARYLYQLLSEKKDVLIVPLMAGATNVTLKQDLFEEVLIPVPSPDVQREIVEHAEWELLAENAQQLRSQVEHGIDGQKSQEIVDLLDQVRRLLHLHAEKKRYISDVWSDQTSSEDASGKSI